MKPFSYGEQFELAIDSGKCTGQSRLSVAWSRERKLPASLGDLPDGVMN